MLIIRILGGSPKKQQFAPADLLNVILPTILEKRGTLADRIQGIYLTDDLLDVHKPTFGA